jgi:hypothetical protein
MAKLAWSKVAAWRTRRHHLDRRAPAGSMLAVAGRLCDLHAQVMSAAELAAWARVDGVERGAIPRAVWEERTLIKTWAMRGTLHLLPAADLPLWHGALATSRRYRSAVGWKRWLGITLEELDGLTAAIGKALEGRVLTREELLREVGRFSGSKARLALNGWGTLLKPAAFAGHLCFAPSVGTRVRFTRPDTWLNQRNRPLEPSAATAELTRRFLSAYAPATVHDCARWWGGASMKTVRGWLGSLGEEVAAVDLEGEQAWMLADDIREGRDLPSTRSVRLLPAFDPYVIGASRHAPHLLPGEFRSRIYRPQGWVSPVVLVNGRMEGTWTYKVDGSRLKVTIEPLATQPAWVRRAAGEEVDRLAEFFGCSVDVVHANRL